MNTTEFINTLAKELGISNRESERTTKAMLKVLSDALKKGEEVCFKGFGTFKIRKTRAHKMFSPIVNHEVKMKARRFVAFRTGSVLKEHINSHHHE